MSTLKEKAEQILQEKEEKIIPENFSQNLEIFGVNGGLYEGDYYGGAYNKDIQYRNNMLTFYGGTGERQIVGQDNVANLSMVDTDVASTIGLTPEKLKKDETILGVTGVLEEGIDTTDANAIADNIEIGKTAYVNGEKIEGTLSLGTSIEANPISATESGNYIKLSTNMSEKIIMVQGSPVELGIRKDYLARDISLTAEKIKKNEVILGITGTYEGSGGIDTSDATATHNDILYNKTAYVNGQKITGTVVTYESGEYLTPRTSELNYSDSSGLIYTNPVNGNNRALRMGAKLKITNEALNNKLKIDANKIYKGSQIGNVVGTYEPDVYKYETTARLLADTKPSVDKLGIVYIKKEKQIALTGKTYKYIYVSSSLENSDSSLSNIIMVDELSQISGTYSTADGKATISQSFDIYSGTATIVFDISTGPNTSVSYSIELEGGYIEAGEMGEMVNYTNAYVSSFSNTSPYTEDLDAFIELGDSLVIGDNDYDFMRLFNTWLQCSPEESITGIYRKTTNSWEDISSKIDIT